MPRICAPQPYEVSGSCNEVKKAIEERNKAAGDDDVPADILSWVGEDSLKVMTQLMNITYKTGE
jgi:hypothetical protein